MAIWGAGEGAELALNLKLGGSDVRLLDAKAAYAPANYVGSRAVVIGGMLAHFGVAVETGQTLKRLEEGAAVFAGSDGSETRVEIDNIVICQGRTANNDLASALNGKGVPVQTIGDARQPRSYANAIHEAAYLVRQL